MSDINGDGRRDLAANGVVYLSNYAGLLSDKTYSTNQVATAPVVEEYFYDDLGRVERVESNDGGIQEYHLDREDNRVAVGKTKPI